MEYVAMYSTGRCANGAQRDSGILAHAVDVGSEMSWAKAWCGFTPGRRSNGWSYHLQPVVTCPRCLKKITDGDSQVTSSGKAGDDDCSTR